MKKLIFPFYIFSIGCLLLSCEEQEDFGINQADKAFNLRMAPDKNSFDISAGDPEIHFTVYSDTKTIDHVEIFVDLVKFGSDGPTSRALLKEIPGNALGNSPSTSVTVNLSEFVSALGLTLDDLGGGDLFNVYNEVTMSDGRVYPDTLEFGDEKFVNVENPFFTAAGTTSFTSTLTFAVLCPFVAADAEGTYTITTDEAEVFWEADYEPVAVAGPGPNQITFKNLFGHPQNYDIVVDVDPATAVATVRKQTAWDTDNFDFGLGEATVEGEGLFFSCTGFITLDLDHSVADGSFGVYKLELTKQ